MISVIVPIYNSAPFLQSCLGSLANQDIDDYEVLLVDDGSTDSSCSICKQFASDNAHFRVVTKVHTGISDTRNYGLDFVAGQYVCWVDSDDYVTPCYLSDLLSSLQDDTDLVLAPHFRCQDHRQLKVCGAVAGVYDFNQSASAESFFRGVDLDHLGVSCCKLFSTAIIRDHQIRYGNSIVLAEDLDFLLRYLSYCNKVIVSTKANYYYNLHSGTVSTTFRSPDVEISGCKQLYSSFSSLLGRFNFCSLANLKGKAIGDYVFRIILSCYKERIGHSARIKYLSSIEKEYAVLYQDFGPQSTFFLRFVNYLFVKGHLSLLDALLVCVIR